MTDVPSGPTGMAVDVSPEAIAALVAAGASALQELPETVVRPDALPLLIGVTHDLRSPLSAMLVLIERLRSGQSGPVTAVQEKQLGLLYAAAFGVARLTNDALDIARGSAGELAGQPTVPFALSHMWSGVRALVQPIAEEKQLRLSWSGPPQDVRLGHASALQRILLNLVTNALKFTDQGEVTVTAEDIGDRVRFEVADSGQGLPNAIRAQLRREGQVDAGLDTSSAGLGIAMCQQMLAALDSRLEVHPGDGRPGTVLGFVLALPPA